MKKTFLLSSLLLAVFLSGCTVWPNKSAVNTDTNPADNQPMTGSDRDEHGCIGSAGYSWCESKNKCLRIWEEDCPTSTPDVAPTTTPDQSKDPASTTRVGGDRDEHGCIGSAGYMWCEPKAKCLRIWEEKCYADDIEEVRYLLAKKYGKQVADVTVVARNKTADYLAGSVKFKAKGLPEPGEGGLVLAAKTGNAWTLVYDGNGSIDCRSIKQNYSFPADFLKGFCD